MAAALVVALHRRDRGDRAGARTAGNLVSQRQLRMGLHRARARRGRRAMDCAHARLAVSRPRPSCRDRAHAGRGRRVLQRHMAGLCRRPDRDGAGTLCGGDQSGAAVAPNADPVAASGGHRVERGAHLAHPRRRRPIICCARCSRPAGISPRPGGGWSGRRLRGRSSSRWRAANAGERCVIERTEDGFTTRTDKTSAANDWWQSTWPWEARVSSAVLLTRTYDEAAANSRLRRETLAAWTSSLRLRRICLGRRRRCSIRSPGSRWRCARRTAPCGLPATRRSRTPSCRDR